MPGRSPGCSPALTLLPPRKGHRVSLSVPRAPQPGVPMCSGAPRPYLSPIIHRGETLSLLCNKETEAQKDCSAALPVQGPLRIFLHHCPAPKTSLWHPASPCIPARAHSSLHLAFQPWASTLQGATYIRIRPSGEAAPLALRELGYSAPAGPMPDAAPHCSGLSCLVTGGWPHPPASPPSPWRSVPGEAGTPRPSEGSGPRHIQSRTAVCCAA